MKISENSRIWIYQANRKLAPTEISAIEEQLKHFTAGWQAHGNALSAKGEIRHQQFIILAVDEQQAGATGCSIDKSVALMKAIEAQFGLSLFDRMQIAYRDENEIKSCSKAEFSSLIASGKVNEETIVFNNLVQTYQELETGWEIPMKDSWHSRIFI